MSKESSGKVLKILLNDTLRALAISDVRLRSNIHHLFASETSNKTKDRKITEAVGNYITAMRADSISWKTMYTFLRSLRIKQIDISFNFHLMTGKEVEVKRRINFNHMEDKND